MSSDNEPVAADGRQPATMQLATAKLDGRPTVVVASGSRCVALRDLVGEGASVPDELYELLAAWDEWRPVVMRAGAAIDQAPTREPEGWLVPVRPSKLICVGVNYHDHLAEMGGAPVPQFPYSFLKPVSTGLVASGSSVRLPVGPKMVDWEAELAIVIGSRLRGVRGPEVLNAVAGYTIYNDLSARDWIASTRPPGIDWVVMKGYDDFSPIGPFVTPAEFVADPQNLPIRCWVNDELKQDSSTSQMIFGVQAILEHLAGIMTLEAGDVIATGTPAGVGFGSTPQQFLQPGDTVTVEVDGLGRLETYMVESSQGATT